MLEQVELPLEEIIGTAELSRRRARPPDFEAENRAVAELMRALADAVGGKNDVRGADPDDEVRQVLQILVERLLELCQAHSCGISMLETNGCEQFRWRAIAGQWARFLNGTMPRDMSPCGTVIDRDAAVLMRRPQRHYPFPPFEPPIEEVLLVPLHHVGKPVGALWIISHDDQRHFDTEDLRLVTSLARFAALAYQLLDNHQQRLARQLAATERLQRISTELIHEDVVDELYEKIVDAAVSFMHADFGIMQLFDPDVNGSGLKLLAFRGFNLQAISVWQWVPADSQCACGVALRTGQRVMIPDVEACDWLAGSGDLDVYRQSGIRAAQSTPLVSRGGRLLGTISTHWRQPCQPSESELRLLDVLARQAADLIDRTLAEDALRQADRRKDEFLAMLAHELRVPLTPLRNSIDILRLSAYGTPTSAEHLCDMMDRQVNHMVRLVDDLLEVSRIAHGTIALRLEPTNLAAIIRSAAESSGPVIAAAGHQLAITLPQDPVPVYGDPVRLAQVFANLLNNAAKYTNRGGQIWLSARRENGAIVVSVRDNGIGISPDVAPRIFDMFMQVDRSTMRGQGGLGVGLTLSKRLVEMHGGTISAQSDGPGQGSEFIVRLPIDTRGESRLASSS